ncbi:FadR/GntR family transcriptional regulator [Bacillus pinisoli]|uniref:FadR/GntR family transcriptional regulator n=1 Tax=Bacillus pinisoli TaxID=2901866 RepID=UPI001FF1039C
MSIPQSKVYIETIKQIHTIIQTDALEPGAKLPSERELSERLGVGRSSVREALRALELLGLIETRRGEGTFVKDFGGHHLVELIGSFILRNEKAKDDLLETKQIIEEQGIRMACEECSIEKLHQLKLLLQKQPKMAIEEFARQLLILTNNRLLLKIWLLLSEYANSSTNHASEMDNAIFESIVESIEAGKIKNALQEYRNITIFRNDC